jgi:hypothetical protein
VPVLGEASEEELAVLVLAVLQALVVVGQERLGAAVVPASGLAEEQAVALHTPRRRVASPPFVFSTP